MVASSHAVVPATNPKVPYNIEKDLAAIARIRPVMEHLGRMTHLGAVGAGQATKLVNQTLVLANYCVMAEALRALVATKRLPVLTTYKAKGVVSDDDPRVLGHFGQAVVGDVGDDNSALCGVADVDIIKPNSQAGDDPAMRRGVDELGRQLSELLQRRDELINSRGAEQNRLGQCRHELIKKQIGRWIAQMTEQIKQLDGLMNKLARSSAELQRKLEQLCQIKGVGQLTALTLLITVPELGTVSRNRISRLVGLAPLNDDSGKQKNKRYIQGGRKRPRAALYMAALTASQHNAVLRAFYQRLLKAGKLKKVALTAVMRKLLICLNALLRNWAKQKAALEAFCPAKASVTQALKA